MTQFKDDYMGVELDKLSVSWIIQTESFNDPFVA